jgi:hypothetical protein
MNFQKAKIATKEDIVQKEAKNEKKDNLTFELCSAGNCACEINSNELFSVSNCACEINSE